MDRMRPPGNPEPVSTEEAGRPDTRIRPPDGAGGQPGPFISLVIPVHNIDGYLGQCLDSITKQEFQDIEIIAVDGGSDDASGKILDERKREEPRLTVLHERRIGPGRARNLGAKQATGEYLWFVDGDDLVLDGSLTAIARRLRASRPDLLFIDHEAMYPDGITEPGDDHPLLGRPTADSFTVADQPWTLELRMAAWNKVIRREFFTARSAAFLSEWPHEDIPVSCLLLLAATRLSVLNRVCYRYRKDRLGSAITSAPLRHNFTIFESYKIIMTRIGELASSRDHMLTEGVRRALFERVIWHYTNVLDRDLRQSRHTAPDATTGSNARTVSSAEPGAAEITAMSPRAWRHDRREFFGRMHRDYLRYAPAGYRLSGGLRGLKFGLVKINAYPIYRSLQPLNDFRVRLGRTGEDRSARPGLAGRLTRR